MLLDVYVYVGAVYLWLRAPYYIYDMSMLAVVLQVVYPGTEKQQNCYSDRI